MHQQSELPYLADIGAAKPHEVVDLQERVVRPANRRYVRCRDISFGIQQLGMQLVLHPGQTCLPFVL